VIIVKIDVKMLWEEEVLVVLGEILATFTDEVMVKLNLERRI
jgi:hypothetical protein